MYLIRFLARVVRSMLNRIDRYVSRLCSSSRILSRLYFLILNREFGREQQLTLLGRKSYYDNLGGAQSSIYLLKRNIHRIEKGLINKNPKPVFAENYILETVQAFIGVTQDDTAPEELYAWFKHVLILYFKTVKSSKTIDKARQQFESALKTSNNQLSAIPFYQLKSNPVNDAAFEKLCQQRHSIRYFQDKPVDEMLLNRAIDIAFEAPSACNRQAFSFETYHDKQAQLIADLAMGTKGFAQDFPHLTVVLGDLSAYPNFRDRHLIYIDGSLSAMQYMLALESMGVSTCPINWPDIEWRERKMARLLQLPAHVRPIMLIAVGYADQSQLVPYSEKVNHRTMLRFSQFQD